MTGEAQKIEQSIWSLWMTSDSPTADALLAQAMKASAADETGAALSILDNVIEVHPDLCRSLEQASHRLFPHRPLQ